MAIEQRYVLLTVKDARSLAFAEDTENDRRVAASVNADTGGDVQGIANMLKGIAVCPACSHEGMAGTCNAVDAQKLGRRLQRLIDRADDRTSA
jgi:hypothetical protein